MILVETLSVLCNLLSLGLIIVATITPYWKIDKSDDLFKNIFPDYNQGLWVRCNQEIKSAKWICSGLEDVYKEIPLEIKISRLFIIVSILSHSLAFLSGVFGLRCISIGGHRPDFKYRLNILSILFHMIDLLSVLACTLSFTIPLLRDYYKPSQKLSPVSILKGSSVSVPSWCIYFLVASFFIIFINIVLTCLITAESAKPNSRFFQQNQWSNQLLENGHEQRHERPECVSGNHMSYSSTRIQEYI
ncbi:Oidioi.mRNA.OKI2018_I69.chr2.g5350.t1.cds [Oikopleura dioica]|uniref:Oidioi.mRNA.OKI2018_I69.chr2.g5350.t1.cds n=1 Tax=Oikopleura dioica TaxID=34765 RepID=A0ABN7T5P9_OIKDI|nr:Oidioi.mRNA.OKI2018_I69.chr2.g5350.t1.cds [Oikopleura dioica]